MNTKEHRNHVILNTIILWGLMAFFLVPVSSEIKWLETLLYIVAAGLLLAGSILLVIWVCKKQLNLTEFVLKDFRGSLLLDMVLLSGFVTNFVAGKERFAYSLLILAVIDVLATLIPVKSGDDK